MYCRFRGKKGAKKKRREKKKAWRKYSLAYFS